MYAHEERNARKCAFYAAWQAPWGDVDVYGRVFLLIEGESAFVAKPSRSDQLVFQKQPRVTNVVFQLASRNKLGLGDKYELRWDKARERHPRLQEEWHDDGGVDWTLDKQYMPDGPSDSGPHGHLPEPQRSVSPAPSQESSDDDSDAMNLKKHPRFGDLLRFRVLLCQVGLTSVPVYARSDLESYQIDRLRCGEEFFGYYMHDPHWVRIGRIGCCPVEVNGRGIVEVADALYDVDVVWVAADVRIRSATLNLLHDDTVRNLVQATTAIFGRDVRAKGTYLAQTLNQVLREIGTLGVVVNNGGNFFLHKATNAGTYQLVLISKQIIHAIIVVVLV